MRSTMFGMHICTKRPNRTRRRQIKRELEKEMWFMSVRVAMSMYGRTHAHETDHSRDYYYYDSSCKFTPRVPKHSRSRDDDADGKVREHGP